MKSLRRRVGIDLSDEPRIVQQHQTAMCDVNNIMAKYKATGIIDHLAKHGATYGDFNGPDYQEAQIIVKRAESAFQDLPARVRAHFDHDPANFLDFVENIDPENPPDEYFELGLSRSERIIKNMAQNEPEITPDSAPQDPKPIDPT